MSTWSEVARFVLLEAAIVAVAVWLGVQIGAGREKARRWPR